MSGAAAPPRRLLLRVRDHSAVFLSDRPSKKNPNSSSNSKKIQSPFQLITSYRACSFHLFTHRLVNISGRI